MIITLKGADFSANNIGNTAINGLLASARINIRMTDGVNIGTGGSVNNATLVKGEFSNGKFTYVDGTGGLSIPVDFIPNTTTPFTALMVFDSWVLNTWGYGRFFRFENDAPSMYYVANPGGMQHKLFKKATVLPTNTTYFNESFFTMSEDGTKAYHVFDDNETKMAIVIRYDGAEWSSWVNGVCIAKQQITGTNEPTELIELQIGNSLQQGDNYNLQDLKCSKIALWDTALTDEQVTMLTN